MDGWMDGWCTVCSGYLVKASPVNIQRQRVFRFGIASHVYEHVTTLWGWTRCAGTAGLAVKI